jgi:hypothetical protein
MGAGLAFTTVLPVVGVTLTVPQNLIGVRVLVNVIRPGAHSHRSPPRPSP